MNLSQTSNYDAPSNFPTLGSYSIEDFDGISQNEAFFPMEARSQPQFQIIVKRDDGLYKTLHAMNTVFSILAVLMIVMTFIMVFYSLVTITEVSNMVSQIKEHNALPVTGHG